MMEHAQITEAVITRLSKYMHYLAEQEDQGKKLISSSDIAQVCGVTAVLVRKDLARFGKLGVKGVGYYIPALCQGIKAILGLDHRLHIAIIGRKDLGLNHLSFKEFLNGNYVIAAVFNTKPTIDARSLTSDIAKSVDILPISCLKEVTKTKNIDIAIVNTVPSEAQEVVDQVVEGGIRGIINFSPIHVRVPRGFIVKNICFAAEQDSLVYLLQSQSL